MRNNHSHCLLWAIAGIFMPVLLQAQFNIAQGKKVTASGIVPGRSPSFLTDGEETVNGQQKNYTETYTGQFQWLEIDLGASYAISSVVLVNGDFGNNQAYNTSLIAVASNTPMGESIYNPLADLPSKNIRYQALNGFQGGSLNAETSIRNNLLNGRYLRIWDSDIGGIRLAEIKVTGEMLSENAGSVQQNGSSNGPNPTGIGMAAAGGAAVAAMSTGDQIAEAIRKKDNSALTKLLKENSGDFTQAHVDNAFTGGQVEQGKRIATTLGIKPSQNTLNTLISTGKGAVVQDLLTNNIIDPNTATLNSAIKSNNSGLVNYLSPRVKANSETFVLLANEGNNDLIEQLFDNDNRLPDNQAINIAIDNNNTALVNLGLNNGGNANDAVTYAISKNNVAMVKLIATKKGVDPGKVFKYAVTNNDEALFTSLLAMPTADPKIALDEAMLAKNDELAILALETNKTRPTKYLKPTIEAGNTKLAKKIVEFGGDANEGMEPAIKKNNTELTEYFVSNGAAVTNPKYMQIAAANGNLSIVKLLVESGAPVTYGLDSAAFHNHPDVVEFMLGKGADANLGLPSAVIAGSMPLVKTMIEHGATATKGVDNAVKKNKPDILSYLIENGADISAPGLMTIAISNHFSDIVKILISNKYNLNNPEYLTKAVALNNTTIFMTLLENGATLPQSGLMEAASGNGNTEIVTALLQKNLSPDPGVLPAIKKNKPDVLQILINNGADVKKDQYAAEAVNAKSAGVIPVLFAAGVDFTKQDAQGNTFLHTAATNNDLNTLSELIKAGVPLDAQNNKGNTALHVAADLKDRVPIILALAKAGCNLNIKNLKGNTAKDVAPNFSANKKALKDLNAD